MRNNFFIAIILSEFKGAGFMIKILLFFALLTSSLYSIEMGKSGGGCTLTQSNAVKIGYNNTAVKEFTYTPKALSGGNFRQLFVGATLHVTLPNMHEKIFIHVLDYKPNKRIKGKPKTGKFMTQFTYKGKQKTIAMNYIFDGGVMKVYADLDKASLKEIGKKNKIKIWFETDIKYSLCHL
jgi:hypothetical protein